MQKPVNNTHATISILCLSAGLITISLSQAEGAPGLFLFVGGLLACVYGLTFLIRWGFQTATSKAATLQKDETGLAWIWTVAALSIIFCPFVYWAIGVPYNTVIETVTAQYTFTGVLASVFTFMRLMVSYLLTFALFGILFWAVVQSKARSMGA